MHKLTSRGIASFAVAGLLVLAPIVSTAALADDAPVTEASIAEAPALEAPAAPAEEAPAPAEAEAPVEVAPADAPAPAPESPVAADEPAAPEQDAAIVSDADAIPIADASIADAQLQAADPVAHGPEPLDQNAITNLRASYSQGVVTVTWDAPLTPASHYDYCWNETVPGSVPDGAPEQGCDGNYSASATSYSFAALPGGQFYVDNWTYRGGVRQFGSAGQAYGVYYTVPSAPAPDAVTNLQATRSSTQNGFIVAWDAPAESANPVESYSIDITDGSGTTSTVTSTSTSYEATGLTVDDTYTFAVSSVSADGQHSEAVETSETLYAISPTVVRDVELSLEIGRAHV